MLNIIYYQFKKINLIFVQFVTCDASISPNNVLKLLIEQWMISLPKIIILINGEFPRRDYSWLNVMSDSWLITNGSSPSHQRSYNSFTIAIMDINSIQGKDVLVCPSNKVGLRLFNVKTKDLSNHY